MVRYTVRLIAWTTVVIAMALVLWRPALRLLFPYPFSGIVHTASAHYDVDPLLLVAIMRTESRFDVQAVSPRGARGLMQIMPDTAEWAAEQIPLPGFHMEQIHDPRTNITIAAWYVDFLLELFQGRVLASVAAYNAGPGTVKRWLDEGTWTGSLGDIDQIPYPETRQYVQRVADAYRLYRRIHPSSHQGYNDLIQ